MQCIPYWALASFAVGLLVVGATIYAAWILLIIPGFVLLFRSWLLLAVPMGAYAAFKAFIHEEDEYLDNRFGQAYSQYRSRVNELFPFASRTPGRNGSLSPITKDGNDKT